MPLRSKVLQGHYSLRGRRALFPAYGDDRSAIERRCPPGAGRSAKEPRAEGRLIPDTEGGALRHSWRDDYGFVVLDRDGTLIVERHYLSDPTEVELIGGAAEGLRRLGDMGVPIVVITNQSGIARGYVDGGAVARIHERLRELLTAEGVHLGGVYVCPHVASDRCRCRKPEVELLERAARDLGCDPRTAFVVGDKASDVELGRRVGATTFLVRTGYGVRFVATPDLAPDYVVDDVGRAAQVIEGLLAKRRRRA
jgi:D-glycero-D-manno-heptose 1,7-bisphosphate phosphatase